jgi:single-strand DNA-binding protein
MSMNKVILVGRLGRNPEKIETRGDTLAKFSVATSERWKDKQTGETQESTEWHNCSLFGPSANYVIQYWAKGDIVQVEGKIKSRTYTDRENVQKTAFEIACSAVSKISSAGPRSTESNNQQPAQTNSQPQQQNSYRDSSAGYTRPNNNNISDDDIPF